MWIGAGRIVLDFYGNSEIKTKKKNLESLCKDIKKKFNVSCLEVSDFEDEERCVIGFAAVMPQNWKEASVQSFNQNLCKTVDEMAFARVTVEDTVIFSHGD